MTAPPRRRRRALSTRGRWSTRVRLGDRPRTPDPLAIVKAAAQTGIIHHGRLDGAAVLRLLETIARNSDLALRLVDRLGLARDIENDTVELNCERIDLAALVAESVGDLGHVVLEGHPVEVTGLDSLHVVGDPTALREIVFNLLANAAKYSAPDAPIEVTVRRADKNAEVVVHDDGAGVKHGDNEAIFGKLYQGDPTSPGAGLGLYISRGLARAHDGDLYVLPGENEGSEFILTLPA